MQHPNGDHDDLAGQGPADRADREILQIQPAGIVLNRLPAPGA